jgi:hypothetical protein
VADDRALIDLKLIDSTGFATEEEKFTNYRRQNTATKEVQDADVSRSPRPKAVVVGKNKNCHFFAMAI